MYTCFLRSLIYSFFYRLACSRSRITKYQTIYNQFISRWNTKKPYRTASHRPSSTEYSFSQQFNTQRTATDPTPFSFFLWVLLRIKMNLIEGMCAESVQDAIYFLQSMCWRFTVSTHTLTVFFFFFYFVVFFAFFCLGIFFGSIRYWVHGNHYFEWNGTKGKRHKHDTTVLSLSS